MRTIATSILIVVSAITLNPIPNAAAQSFDVKTQNGRPIFISTTPGSAGIVVQAKSPGISVADQALGFLTNHQDILGLAAPQKALKLINQERDEQGNSHLRFGQFIDGVPLDGAQYTVHVSQSGTITSAILNGLPSEPRTLSTLPSISEAEATEIATAKFEAANGPVNARVVKSQLLFINQGLIDPTASGSNTLVWKIGLFDESSRTHTSYFVNATSSVIEREVNEHRDGISRKIVDCSFGDGKCYLDAYYAPENYTYGRSEGKPARGVNPTYRTNDTDLLYEYIGSTHNYFLNHFGRNGANNFGGIGDGANYPIPDTAIFSYIDYATWGQGVCPNAFYDGLGSMNFCKGIIAPDVAGHEYTHAVGHYSVLDNFGSSAGLNYKNESGALNESLSDIFGIAIEAEIKGQAADWFLLIDPSTGEGRSMSNPPANHLPDRVGSQYYFCGAQDEGGVHTNSSVLNHGAYLMSQGGSFNGCSMVGIGLDKTTAIFYRAYTHYLTPSSNFASMYFAAGAACSELYDSSVCKQVAKALKSVELDQGPACLAPPHNPGPDCAAIEAGTLAIPQAPKATPTPSPKTQFRIAAGAGKKGDKTSATSGALYMVVYKDTPASGSEEKSLLGLKVGNAFCPTGFVVPVADQPIYLKTSLPKVSKNMKITLIVSNELQELPSSSQFTLKKTPKGAKLLKKAGDVCKKLAKGMRVQ